MIKAIGLLTALVLVAPRHVSAQGTPEDAGRAFAAARRHQHGGDDEAGDREAVVNRLGALRRPSASRVSGFRTYVEGLMPRSILPALTLVSLVAAACHPGRLT